MKWFFDPKDLKFPEIGCRPPGVGQWDGHCAAGEFGLYREWALAVCHHTTDHVPSRRYACGLISLRPDRDGVISHCDRTDQIWGKYGDLIVGAHFSEPGTPAQAVEAAI